MGGGLASNWGEAGYQWGGGRLATSGVGKGYQGGRLGYLSYGWTGLDNGERGMLSYQWGEAVFQYGVGDGYQWGDRLVRLQYKCGEAGNHWGDWRPVEGAGFQFVGLAISSGSCYLWGGGQY